MASQLPPADVVLEGLLQLTLEEVCGRECGHVCTGHDASIGEVFKISKDRLCGRLQKTCFRAQTGRGQTCGVAHNILRNSSDKVSPEESVAQYFLTLKPYADLCRFVRICALKMWLILYPLSRTKIWSLPKFLWARAASPAWQASHKSYLRQQTQPVV
eukprot:COSAG05_NODE_2501_length_2977_cov_1.785268_1_plen_158_part_00